MGVFLLGGFISVAAHRTQPDDVMIRSRNSDHLSIIFPSVKSLNLMILITDTEQFFPEERLMT